MLDAEYRSIDLLLIIAPDVAEHLIRCFAVGLFVSHELDKVYTIEDMDAYVDAIRALQNFGVDGPDKYLNYKNTDEAWRVFDKSAEKLALMDIKERIPLFYELTIMFIEKSISCGLLSFFGHNFLHAMKKLGISGEDGHALFKEAFFYISETNEEL
jgi:hypothetical protein